MIIRRLNSYPFSYEKTLKLCLLREIKIADRSGAYL